MPDTNDVGKRLKNLRESKGISQEELAREIGVDRSTIGMYETGKRIPRDATKIRLAKIFNITVESLFFTD